MNKQNFYKNISLVNCKQPKITSKLAQPQTSFRNINAKSFFKESREETSRSPATTKRNKTNNNRVQNSMLHTEISDSIIGNQNNNLLEAFRLQRESLINTVKLYKQQIEVLTQENVKLKKQTTKSKSKTKQGEQALRQQLQKRKELTKKVQEYEDMLPKLVQLQHMSEKIINQNNQLKNKIKMQEALLNNVANITKYEQNKSPALQKIWTLTQSYLTASVSKRNKKE